jgi:hypothetical protein
VNVRSQASHQYRRLRHRRNVTRPAIARSRTLTTGRTFTTSDVRPHTATTRHLNRQLDLDLELAADLDHAGHDQTIDPDKTANVILRPLFPPGPRLRQREASKGRRMPSLSEPQPR